MRGDESGLCSEALCTPQSNWYHYLKGIVQWVGDKASIAIYLIQPRFMGGSNEWCQGGTLLSLVTPMGLSSMETIGLWLGWEVNPWSPIWHSVPGALTWGPLCRGYERTLAPSTRVSLGSCKMMSSLLVLVWSRQWTGHWGIIILYTTTWHKAARLHIIGGIYWPFNAKE